MITFVSPIKPKCLCLALFNPGFWSQHATRFKQKLLDTSNAVPAFKEVFLRLHSSQIR